MTRPLAVLVLTVWLAATLAGCGESPSSSNGVASRTPAQIVVAATEAAAGAATVHVAGSIVSEGRPISINMELVAGKGGQGRITLAGLDLQAGRASTGPCTSRAAPPSTAASPARSPRARCTENG